MSGRLFAILVLLAASVTTEAQVIPIERDGCAKLAQVVYTEVQSSALYGPTGSGPWYIGSGQDDIQVCNTVAKTVSRAFTSAMRNAGLEVFWADEPVPWSEVPDPRGDVCLSHYLSQCYPQRGDYNYYATDQQIVQKSWAVVSQLVMREMHNPFSSDEVRYRPDDLKLRIGLSLRNAGTEQLDVAVQQLSEIPSRQ